MAQLRQDYGQFVERSSQIVVVNPEEAGQVKEFRDSQDLPFPMLIDPDHEVANAYGQEVNLLKLGRLPALVVLDRSGVVQYEHFGSSMMDIVKNQTLLAVLDRLNAEAARQPAESEILSPVR